MTPGVLWKISTFDVILLHICGGWAIKYKMNDNVGFHVNACRACFVNVLTDSVCCKRTTQNAVLMIKCIRFLLCTSYEQKSAWYCRSSALSIVQYCSMYRLMMWLLYREEAVLSNYWLFGVSTRSSQRLHIPTHISYLPESYVLPAVSGSRNFHAHQKFPPASQLFYSTTTIYLGTPVRGIDH